MKIAFTVCSFNYLGQAKTLADSVAATNPDYLFLIGLADKINGRSLHGIEESSIVEVEEIKIPNFDWMIDNYNIVEFATAIKPFYFSYLFKKYPEATEVTYFDPDMLLFKELDELDEMHRENQIILTPHFTSPIVDEETPTEKHVFNTGIFNLGFLSLKRGNETEKLLEWWSRKLSYECILDLTRGYFVDQLWMSLAPVLFDKVLITKHPGMNIAHWNFHERTIQKNGDSYQVNGQDLVFFHFSHYKPDIPHQLAAFHSRFTLDNRPDLQPLYENYRTRLLNNHFSEFIKEPCIYMKNEKSKARKKYFQNLARVIIPTSVKIKLGNLLKKNKK